MKNLEISRTCDEVFQQGFNEGKETVLKFLEKASQHYFVGENAPIDWVVQDYERQAETDRQLLAAKYHYPDPIMDEKFFYEEGYKRALDIFFSFFLPCSKVTYNVGYYKAILEYAILPIMQQYTEKKFS